MIRLLQILIIGCALALSMVEALHCASGQDSGCSSEAECSGPCECHTIVPSLPVSSIPLHHPAALKAGGELRPPQLLLISDIFRPPASSLC
jgi:hypothetical protein